MGDSLDEPSLIGPMASPAQREQVQRYIERSAPTVPVSWSAGPVVPTACTVSGSSARLCLPTLDNNATVAREEIFGAALSVIPCINDAEAVAIGNDSYYGLGASVWSTDPDRATTVAIAVQTGTIGINNPVPDPLGPFDGVKASGIGKSSAPRVSLRTRR